jgi:adenosylcobinamide kinase/adenosylcobinamide-phosphate guanylyltransferase
MSGKKGKVTLVLGGAKSGKSRFALDRASALTGGKAYIATARALDSEMAERIARHKAERSSEWTSFEEPLDIASLIRKIDKEHAVLLIDCLTLWVTNLMLGGRDTKAEGDTLLHALCSCRAEVFIVSNEVGLGIVPDNALARQFRDEAGRLNQKVASIADEVYFMAAGLPLKMK